MKDSLGYSLLIPTYNERDNLNQLTSSLNGCLNGYNYEVILIDDDSPDGTFKIAQEISKKYYNLRLITRSEKLGIGSAYKDGFKVSTGGVIIGMDADLSHNPSELPKLMKAISNADVVVGSRYVKGGSISGWKWYRKSISKIANLLASLFLDLKIRDATSGFRAYKREAFNKIVSISEMNGFEFQVEALYLASKLDLKVVEVPITFVNRKNGKSKLHIKDILKFLELIVRIAIDSKRSREYSSKISQK